jgi:hypothetical protein
MARASVRVACGLLAGIAILAPAPAAAAGVAGVAETARAGCVAPVMYLAPAGPVPSGSTEPWSLPLLRGQPDPDHLRRECAGIDDDYPLRQPLWEGPAWGLPSLGSFV